MCQLGWDQVCEDGPCVFSDAKTSSKDEQEPSASMRKLLIVVVLCVIFMSVEVVGGIKAHSQAILTDTAHLLSDVAAFAISLFSLWPSGWEGSHRQSYGFFQIEILDDLAACWILVYESIARLINDTGEVMGFLMFLISAFGLLVNIAMALLLGHDHGHDHGHGHGHGGHGHGHGDHNHSYEGHDETHNHGIILTTHHSHHQEVHSNDDDKHHHTEVVNITEPLLNHSSEGDKKPEGKKKKQRNINVQGAYLHVLGDSIQSIGVMIGGGLIWYKPEWKIVDLICTLVFSIIALATTIRMLRNILEVLM
ncbi:hypothetical protein C1H46_001450 [Malus baccata]|uniref:Cation efflux protein transmembrane domain-containing protein n=1 Tax=Malus baccata TaxID=106549 RepID=A0A540NP28_MALBA|nr:hypothetical protein C1H46_001450 [Malus baccata]